MKEKNFTRHKEAVIGVAARTALDAETRLIYAVEGIFLELAKANDLAITRNRMDVRS